MIVLTNSLPSWEAISKGDAKQFQQSSHSLKGTTEFVSATRISTMAASIVQCAIQNNFELGRHLYEQPITEKEVLKAMIKEFLESNKNE